VHEAFLRLDRAGQSPADLGDRFYFAAAEAMRRILIEHARARKASKRGGDGKRLELATSLGGVADLSMMPDAEEFEVLDRAILRLQDKDARAGDVVRLRFFAGLSLEEVARAL